MKPIILIKLINTSCINEGTVRCNTKNQLIGCFDNDVIVNCKSNEDCYQFERDAYCLSKFEPPKQCKQENICHPSNKAKLSCINNEWKVTDCPNDSICTIINSNATCSEFKLQPYCKVGQVKCDVNKDNYLVCNHDLLWTTKVCGPNLQCVDIPNGYKCVSKNNLSGLLTK